MTPPVFASLFWISLVFTLAALANHPKGIQNVPSDVYQDLVYYFKYATSAYSVFCPYPNGQSLVEVFKNMLTETQGYIARDDTRKEIVVALRGSLSMTDMITDAGVLLLPFQSPGVVAPSNTLVHAGFLNGWNSVALMVIRAVGVQLKAHSDYSVVTSGHSLGGALASIAAMSLKAHFPLSNVTLYTYGQPRTGNSVYANWVNDELGPNAFRVVHTYDGVPTIIPTREMSFFRNGLLNSNYPFANYTYRHHGVEYWQNPDPPSEYTTRRCATHGEDPDCSSSIRSTGINMAHWMYFNILSIRPFCAPTRPPSLQ